MTKHTISMVTYDRGTYDLTGKTKPYHWSFFIHTRTDQGRVLGIAHQIRGMPGYFRYPGPENVELGKSQSLKEQLEIGEVDESDMQTINDILKGLRIDAVESSGWNCQDWALDGLEQLRSKGFVYSHMTNDVVKNWLKET